MIDTNKSTRQLLLEVGYLVTEKRNCIGTKMITDLEGNEIGYYNPIEAVEYLVKPKIKDVNSRKKMV